MRGGEFSNYQQTFLSGGQKQRLALARGIVNNPAVLILDESTGALDPISETEVLKSLFTHRQNKTTIMISHRPPVIQKADWIILLEEGKVKQEGSVDRIYQESEENRQFLTV